ncbi:MAG: carbon-nitrogen hydrolase family protein [Acidimicrobiia bacterium]
MAAEGVRLAVFPETYVPGYPFWAWYIHPLDDIHARGEIYGRLLENSVNIEAGDLGPVQTRAAAHGLTVLIGVNEKSPESKTSLYNTLVTIGSDGAIRNVHRKLVPTYVERNVWAPGDGAGLRVVETELGRIGGLICWENLMPLARYSLYAQGVDIYVVSTYDAGDASVATMRHIARESRSWVVCSGVALHRDDIPADFPARDKIVAQLDSEWQNAGDSVVVSPSGHIVAGPLRNEYGTLYADIDPTKSRQQGWYMDTAGHYNRPDIFTVTVDRTRRTAVTYLDGGETEAEGLEGE